MARSASAWAMNSGPLSMRINSGAPRLHQFIQSPGDPGRWQAGVNLDAQCLAVEFVDDVEGAKAWSRPQGIDHEVAALAGSDAPLPARAA